MAKIKKEESLLLFLKEHISYERLMLKHCYSRLQTLEQSLDRNCIIESFCIHARNLYDFFRNDYGKGQKSRTFIASNYSKSWKKSVACAKFNDIDGYVCHLSSDRLKPKTLDGDRLKALAQWLDGEWAKWAAMLIGDFTEAADADDPICREPPSGR